MDIKELKGTVHTANLLDGMLAQRKLETFGALWEDYVDCNHCIYSEKCRAICEHYEDKGINLYCGQVIDYLLGDLDLDTLTAEVQ